MLMNFTDSAFAVGKSYKDIQAIFLPVLFTNIMGTLKKLPLTIFLNH